MEARRYEWERCGKTSRNVTPLEVLIVYEDLETGLRAKAFFDRIMGRLEGEVWLNLHLWKAGFLDRASMASERAGEAAGRATVIAVSLRSGGEFWLPARRWLEHAFLRHREGEPCAVVLLAGEEGDEMKSMPEVAASYQKWAREAGIDLFCGGCRQAAGGEFRGEWWREQVIDPARKSTSILEVVLRKGNGVPGQGTRK